MTTKFGDVLLLRMAICHAALGLKPHPLEFVIKLAVDGPSVCQGLVPGKSEIKTESWELFTLTPNDPCPMTRVRTPAWMIEGCAAIKPDFDPVVLDPMAIIANLRDVVNSAIPATAITPDVWACIDCLEEAAAKCDPELVNEIRKSFRIKGMAVDDHVATGTHSNYDEYASRLPS